MKSKLVGAALILAAFGLGCQRTYEDRPSAFGDYTTAQNDNAQVADPDPDPDLLPSAPGNLAGEEGQHADVNAMQDMTAEEPGYGTDETEESFGGSGSAGMTAEGEEPGWGGSADAGTRRATRSDAGTMMNHGDMMKSDAGMMNHHGMNHDGDTKMKMRMKK